MRDVVPDPVAVLLTWTTHGSWLPGDRRGWTDATGVPREPNPRLARRVAASLGRPPVEFDFRGRRLVEQAVAEHCRFAGWILYSVQCRTTHVHVVVSAPGVEAAVVLSQLKAWSTRALRGACARDHREILPRVWTRGGSVRRLFDDDALMAAVTYVRNCQDGKRYRHR